MRTLVRLAELELQDAPSNATEQLNKILALAIDDPRGSVLVHDFASRHDLSDVSDAAYRQAASLIDQASKLPSRIMVARVAGQRGDWSEVIRILDHKVDTTRSSPDLDLLIMAFANEVPVRQRAIQFFDSLPDTVRAHRATAIGIFQMKRGDLPLAREALERALLTDPHDMTALLALFNVLQRASRATANQEFSEWLAKADLNKLKGSPTEKMSIAHILRQIGQPERALEFAYTLVHALPNAADVAMGYVGLILGGREELSLLGADQVAVGNWAKLENADGEIFEFVFELQSSSQPDVYGPNHLLVRQATGLKVGESFTARDTFGHDQSWKVVAVKNRYLHELHRIMETFNVRFPDAKGFYRLKHKEGDLTPVLAEVRRAAEQSTKFADLYADKNLPLSMLAGMVHRDVIGLAYHIIQIDRKIITCGGNFVERAEAENAITDSSKKGVVLDTYTAWFAAAIDLLPHLRKLFGKLLIARSTLDQIDLIQLEAEDTREGSLTVGYDQGQDQFIKHEWTKEQIDARVSGITKIKAAIEAQCEVSPVEKPDDLSTLGSLILEISGPHVLDPIFLAYRHNAVLLSEDLFYRKIAKQLYRTPGCWLQVALNVALKRRELQLPEYAEAIAQLALNNHDFIFLNADHLIALLKIDTTDAMVKFRAVARWLGGPTADMASHIEVAIEFCDSVWQLDLPELKVSAASGIVLENLFRRGAFPSKQTAGFLALHLSNPKARKYFAQWLVGHFYEFSPQTGQ